MDAQQELFNCIKLDLEARGYDVYDGFLPPPDTPYPFIYLGDMNQSDTFTKREIVGTVSAMIHVWHNNPRQRGTVSNMLLNIKDVCARIDKTAHCGWLLQSIDSYIVPDNTTSTPLMHGVVNASMKFTRR